MKILKILPLLLILINFSATFAGVQVQTGPAPPQPVMTYRPSNANVVSPEDKDIISNIQTNIDQDVTLYGTNITVSSQQGAVILSGTVDTQAQADAAVKAAQSVSGVKTVKPNITVNQK